MNETFQFAALTPILPEIGLAVGAMVLLMIGAIAGERTLNVVVALSVLLLAVVGYFVATMPASKAALGGSFVSDEFARFMKLLAIAGSAFAIILSRGFLAASGRKLFEFPILILLATAGMMVMVSAGDLIAL